MKERVLVVMAHPDDEILGCGGVIAKHCRDGDRVIVAILGRGKSSRLDESNADRIQEEIVALHEEAVRANALLGVHEVVYHDFPDNAMDTIPLLSVIQFVSGLKKRFRPTIVYTHHHADINIDHQQIFRAVITAFRPIVGEQVSYIYSCEVPSSTEWQAPFAGFAFQPNMFVDITDTLELKKQALAEYRSELRRYPHPRSVEAIDVIAKRWGGMVGYLAAEPFVLVRGVVRSVTGGPRFVLRPAREDDRDHVLEWRNDPLARRMSDHQRHITASEHTRWFRTKLASSECRMYIAVADLDERLGVVRFDLIQEGVARVSINVVPSLRRRGVGKRLLELGVDCFLATNPDVHRIEAIIKDENAHSAHLFAQVGFSQRSESEIAGFFALSMLRE